MSALILILGDQLSASISSLKGRDKARDRILMAEVSEEASYVRHHKKKLILVFSAMRHFAESLRAQGWQISYVRLDDKDNTGSLTGELQRACQHYKPDAVHVTEAGEWRLMEAMKAWQETLGLPVHIAPDTRFIASHDTFQSWAKGRKQLRMEYFYREMRRKTGLLMDAEANPQGGKWNYDQDNRKPPGADLTLPKPLHHEPDTLTKDVISLVKARFDTHFGDAEPFWFGVTKIQAEAVRDHFINEALPKFGDYQDAMLRSEKFLYHSLLSFYINLGLLDPLTTCKLVEDAYKQGRAPLNAAEGFIRQIIGWREYIRGIYWLKMPDYVEENFFKAARPLPDFYWTGETDMACLAAAITQTKEEAYAHHIQRLMITGNFALIAGIDPKAVHEWYLAVYADAYEWVELPNTLGMSQFADGGVLASKPYAASGNYIHKMSDYCKACAYNVKEKTGEKACPFNYLYWDFLHRNSDKLKNNPRMAQMYATWARMNEDKQNAYLKSARTFLDAL